MHDKQYVDAVRAGTPVRLACSQGFDWDEKSFDMYVAHNAGCVAAVDDVLANGGTAITLSSGLHHARTSHGSAFCTFNGVALAALYGIYNGAKNVLIFDFDAHGGGGTMEFVRRFDMNISHRDIVVSPFDMYDVPEGRHEFVHSQPHTYLADISAQVERAEREHNENPYDLFVYNAGMDPANARVSPQDLHDRETMVFDFAAVNGIPTVATMAGGYTFGDMNDDGLAELHMATINAAALVGNNVSETQ